MSTTNKIINFLRDSFDLFVTEQEAEQIIQFCIENTDQKLDQVNTSTILDKKISLNCKIPSGLRSLEIFIYQSE